MKRTIHKLKERLRTYGILQTVLYYTAVVTPVSVSRRLCGWIANLFLWSGKNKLNAKVNDTEIFIDPTNPWAVRVYLFNLSYDYDHIRAARSIPPHYIFFDVGANFGPWTFSLAKHFSWVYAIEPSPVCYQYMCLTKEHMQRDTVIPLNIALGENDGHGEFFSNTSHSGDGRIYNSGDRMRGEPIPVIIRSFDSLMKELDITAMPLSIFMKIDTQGTEPQIVKGMSQTLRAVDDFILYTELSQNELEAAGESLKTYLALLQRLGFKPVDITKGLKEVSWSDVLFSSAKTKNWCFRYTQDRSVRE